MLDDLAAILGVPAFARLDEYFEPWAFSPQRFEAFRDALMSINWATHSTARAEAPAPISNLVPANKAGKSVSIIRLGGTLMKQRASTGGTSTIEARQAVRAAMNSPDITGILLAIDSPGGTISGTMELAEDVRQANRKKPVIAHAIDEMNSAAYWVGAMAGSVYANVPTATIGSIGALILMPNQAGSSGPKFQVYASTPLKSAGYVEATDDHKAYLQGLVDHYHQVFASAVQSGRRLTANQLAAVATGAAFPAPEAQRLRLIDGIRPVEASIAELAKVK